MDFESLDEVAAGRGVGLVGRAEEHVDFAVVVGRSEHLVEIHRAVKETPRDVAHQRAQEGVDRHRVEALGGRDIGEIFVAPEVERAGLEALVAGDVVGGIDSEILGDRQAARIGDLAAVARCIFFHGHGETPPCDLNVSVLANLSPFMDRFGPIDGLNHQCANARRVKTIGGADRQHRHMALAEDDAAHLLAVGIALELVGAFAFGIDNRNPDRPA